MTGLLFFDTVDFHNARTPLKTANFLACSLQNDVDVTKSAPALHVSKPDNTSAPKPASTSLDDTEKKKLQDECKRLQTEVARMAEENRQLKVTFKSWLAFITFLENKSARVRK